MRERKRGGGLRDAPDSVGEWALRRLENHSLAMVLLLDRRFRVVLGVCLLVSLVALAILPKAWRVSPEGVNPTLRISALDWLQARTLARGARKAAERGDLEASVQGWRLAVANDPGFVDGLRQLVAVETRRWSSPSPPEDLWGVEHADWLLRLTETNRVDLDAAVTLVGCLPLDWWTLRLLEGREKLNSIQEFELLKAKLRASDVEGFLDARSSRRYPASFRAELQFYDWAYAAGWAGDDAAYLSLLGTLENPRWRRPVSALCHVVARERDTVEGYRRLIRKLERYEGLGLELNLDFWEALVRDGQSEEVRSGLLGNAFPLRNGVQLSRMIGLYRNVGLEGEVRRLLEGLLAREDTSLEFALAIAQEMIRYGDWETLEAFAVRLRTREQASVKGSVLSLYLEGLASDSQGDREGASTSFSRIADQRAAPISFLERLSRELDERHYHAAAFRVLQGLSPEEVSDPLDYWKRRSRVAYAVDDLEDFLEAAQRAYSMDDTDLVAVNNYAAALMALGRESAKALRLAQRVFTNYPNSVAAGINRAKALHLVGRTEEAFAYLDSLDASTLDRTEMAEAGLLTMEILVDRERWGDAVELAGALMRMDLLPSQERRFADLQKTAQSASYGLW